jgi:hypothetical protein
MARATAHPDHGCISREDIHGRGWQAGTADSVHDLTSPCNQYSRKEHHEADQYPRVTGPSARAAFVGPRRFFSAGLFNRLGGEVECSPPPRRSRAELQQGRIRQLYRPCGRCRSARKRSTVLRELINPPSERMARSRP